jgi:hypothetical protein
MDGSWAEIVFNFSRVLYGIWLGTAAVVGFALTPLTKPWRFAYGALALMVCLPPAAFSNAIYVNFVGIVAAIALLGIDLLRARAAKRATA